MHLFLAWRAMEDRIGSLGYSIERVLWGDSRARHTFLIVCSDEHPLTLIEIDVGDREKGIKKGMNLKIVELEEVPTTISKIELIGETSSTTAFEILIRSAQTYVQEHPDYHVLFNNCRTFVEYLIDQIPEFRDTVPRKNGSILEYYHSQAKHDHPGALVKSRQLVRDIRDIHRRNKSYKYTAKLVVSPEIPDSRKIINNNIIEQRF
ncbi:hypothetical protein I4U23_009220 [Adineta vaga]|nr:hypothetical protein I4U23_009220 [Adineta vaga]